MSASVGDTRALSGGGAASLAGTGAAAAGPRRSIVVFSSGRSGSNRLLEVFDAHEWTNCRNELDADDPRLAAELEALASVAGDADRAARWQETVARIAVRKGRRDRYELAHKAYLRPGLGTAWTAIYRRSRLRRWLVRGAANDWRIAPVALVRGAPGRIVPVVKLGQRRSGLIEAFSADQGMTLVHNLREPAGYARSFYNRTILAKDRLPEDVYAQILPRARAQCAARGLAPPAEDYSVRDLLRARLVMWRETNERILAAGRGSPRYLLATYDRVTSSPVEEARRLYAAAGLDFTDAHAARIGAMHNVLFARPHKISLDAALLDDVVAEIVADSPLAALFPAAGAPDASPEAQA